MVRGQKASRVSFLACGPRSLPGLHPGLTAKSCLFKRVSSPLLLTKQPHDSVLIAFRGAVKELCGQFNRCRKSVWVSQTSWAGFPLAWVLHTVLCPHQISEPHVHVELVLPEVIRRRGLQIHDPERKKLNLKIGMAFYSLCFLSLISSIEIRS